MKLIPIAVFAIVVNLVFADGAKMKDETFQTDVKESKSNGLTVCHRKGVA